MPISAKPKQIFDKVLYEELQTLRQAWRKPKAPNRSAAPGAGESVKYPQWHSAMGKPYQKGAPTPALPQRQSPEEMQSMMKHELAKLARMKKQGKLKGVDLHELQKPENYRAFMQMTRRTGKSAEALRKIEGGAERAQAQIPDGPWDQKPAADESASSWDALSTAARGKKAQAGKSGGSRAAFTGAKGKQKDATDESTSSWDALSAGKKPAEKLTLSDMLASAQEKETSPKGANGAGAKPAAPHDPKAEAEESASSWDALMGAAGKKPGKGVKGAVMKPAAPRDMKAAIEESASSWDALMEATEKKSGKGAKGIAFGAKAGTWDNVGADWELKYSAKAPARKMNEKKKEKKEKEKKKRARAPGVLSRKEAKRLHVNRDYKPYERYPPRRVGWEWFK